MLTMCIDNNYLCWTANHYSVIFIGMLICLCNLSLSVWPWRRQSGLYVTLMGTGTDSFFQNNKMQVIHWDSTVRNSIFMHFILLVNGTIQSRNYTQVCVLQISHRLNIKPGVPQREESLWGQNTFLSVQYSRGCHSVWCVTDELMGKRHNMRSNTGNTFKPFTMSWFLFSSYLIWAASSMLSFLSVYWTVFLHFVLTFWTLSVFLMPVPSFLFCCI